MSRSSKPPQTPSYRTSQHHGQAKTITIYHTPTKASEYPFPCRDNMHTCTFIPVQRRQLWGPGKNNMAHTFFITITILIITLNSYT